MPRHPPLPRCPRLRHDDAMETVVLVLSQVVMWPLAALLAWRAVHHDGRLATIATIAIVVSSAVSSWDPSSESALSRVAVAVSQMSIYVLFATYPNGRFVPRWIWIPMAVGIAIQLVDLASGLALEHQSWWPWQFPVLWGVLLIGGQIHRYRRRSSVEERERIRWPILALVVMVMLFSILTITLLAAGIDVENSGTTWLANLLNLLPAVGFAVGLLAPRLLPVDRALRMVLLIGGWALLVSLVVWGASTLASGMDASARAWWTAAAAVIASFPAAWLARRTADAVVYGRSRDPLATLARLGDRLQASVDPRSVPADIVSTIADTLGLEYVKLAGDPNVSAVHGTAPSSTGPHAQQLVELPIVYRGETLATLTAAPRRGESAMSSADRATLAHVTAQAGAALHGARVVGELIQARSRVVRAREEERKRLRRDLHDELAPTFAGLGLSAAAVETFTRAGDTRASDAAAQLVEGLQAASRQLRDVAYDLRPPVLDDEGLVAALRERIMIPGSTPEIVVDAPDERLELPAAVESAAYRIAQEAVMNVRRHAAASRCLVTIAIEDDVLRLEVTDDGVGVRPGRPGVGMRSMRERAVELGGTLDLVRPGAGGTTVIALLPLGADPPTAVIAAADSSGVGR